MKITTVIQALKAAADNHQENSINSASSSDDIIEYLGSRFKKIPEDFREYLSLVDGGAIPCPMFHEYVKSDFRRALGRGNLISHKDMIEISEQKFSDSSIYTRTVEMGSDQKTKRTVPIYFLGDGMTIDYMPANGKVYLFGSVIAESISDFLIKVSLTPRFTQDLENRCQSKDYPYDWVCSESSPDEHEQAFIEITNKQLQN